MFIYILYVVFNVETSSEYQIRKFDSRMTKLANFLRSLTTIGWKTEKNFLYFTNPKMSFIQLLFIQYFAAPFWIMTLEVAVTLHKAFRLHYRFRHLITERNNLVRNISQKTLIQFGNWSLLPHYFVVSSCRGKFRTLSNIFDRSYLRRYLVVYLVVYLVDTLALN